MEDHQEVLENLWIDVERERANDAALLAGEQWDSEIYAPAGWPGVISCEAQAQLAKQFHRDVFVLTVPEVSE